MGLNPKKLAKMLKLRALGWSQKEIAEELGTSQQVIAYQLNKLKKQSKKKGVDDVFSTALLAGLAGAAGGLALAMLLQEMTKK